MANIWDMLSGGANSTADPNSDPTGAYFGNLINPQTAGLFQQARQQQGNLANLAGVAQSASPFPNPIASGIFAQLQQQNLLPQQAVQSAQAGDLASQADYRKLQGLQLLQNIAYQRTRMGNIPNQYPMGASGGGVAAPGTAQPDSGDTFADKVIQAESRGNDVPNGNGSSASGYGQFMPKTFLSVYRQANPDTVLSDQEILSLRHDLDTNRQMVNAYGNQNAQTLANAGIPVNHATLYGAHFLGPNGAVKVFSASGDTPLSNLLSDSVINANPNLKGKTVADFSNMMMTAMKMNAGQGGAQATMVASAGNLPAGMQLPPGVTNDQVMAARRDQAIQSIIDNKPDPYQVGLANYGLNVAQEAAKARNQADAEIYKSWNVPQIGRPGAQVLVGGNPIYSVPERVPGVNDLGQPTSQFVAPPIGQGGSATTQNIPGTNYAMGGANGLPPPRPNVAAPTMQGSNLGSGGAGGFFPARPLVPSTGPSNAPNGFSGGSTPPAASGAPGGSVAAPSGNVVTGLSPQQTQEFEGIGKGLASEYHNEKGTGVLDRYDAAQSAMPNLLALERALTGFRTGPTAEYRLGAMKNAQDLLSTMFGADVSPDIKNQIASGEIINKTSTRLGYELARTLGSREAQNIVQQAISSNPNILNSPQGNETLVQLIKQGLQRDVDKRNAFDSYWTKNHTFMGAASAFDKSNPIEMYQSRVLPYQVKSPADVGKLPAGTKFVTPDGQTGTAKGGS